jgi:hypothetical protein
MSFLFLWKQSIDASDEISNSQILELSERLSHAVYSLRYFPLIPNLAPFSFRLH